MLTTKLDNPPLQNYCDNAWDTEYKHKDWELLVQGIPSLRNADPQGCAYRVPNYYHSTSVSAYKFQSFSTLGLTFGTVFKLANAALAPSRSFRATSDRPRYT